MSTSDIQLTDIISFIQKVTMNSQEAASLATREANPVIDGRKANVNLAYLGAKPRVIPTPTGKNIFIFFFFFEKIYRIDQTILSALIVVQAA
jgi:hypothetical protein